MLQPCARSYFHSGLYPPNRPIVRRHGAVAGEGKAMFTRERTRVHPRILLRRPVATRP